MSDENTTRQISAQSIPLPSPAEIDLEIIKNASSGKPDEDWLNYAKAINGLVLQSGLGELAELNLEQQGPLAAVLMTMAQGFFFGYILGAKMAAGFLLPQPPDKTVAETAVDRVMG